MRVKLQGCSLVGRGASYHIHALEALEVGERASCIVSALSRVGARGGRHPSSRRWGQRQREATLLAGAAR